MSQIVFVCALGLALAGCGARQGLRTDMSTPGAPTASAAPVASAAAPSAPMLQPDAFDAPAPAAAAEAERAARVLAEMHHMHHGSYVHVDAGRSPAAPPSPRPSASPAHHHRK